MKLTLRLIANLRKILEGESIPYSSLPQSFADSLVGEGLLNVEYHGSRRCLRTHNTEALLEALPQYNEALCDLEAAEAMLCRGYGGITASDMELSRLIAMIHRYRRCYDQEGYIVAAPDISGNHQKSRATEG